MYALYGLLSVIALLLASPYLLYQALRHRKYVGNLRQRLGDLPPTLNPDREPSIWIHAVSVGETLTARALIGDLKARYPSLKLFVSTTTLTGHEVALKLADVDGVFYFPFDWNGPVGRALEVVRPRAFVMMETEIWPTLLRRCREGGTHAILVNGRVSSRSYARYRLVRPFLRRVLTNVDRFCMQSEEAARRIVDLGAPRERVSVTGSLKFDALDHPHVGPSVHGRDPALSVFRRAEGRPVIIAASTLRGEDSAALDAFRRVKALWPDTLLVIAPRHPERFSEVERLAVQAGFRVQLRTELPVEGATLRDVVVLDTIGELARVYQLASTVFVGGSLVDAGGHNILEPAVFGKPIVFGPHMQNFAEIADEFIRHDAALQVRSAHELGDALLMLTNDPVRRASLGAAARALVESNRGAKARTLAVIADLVPARDTAHGPATVRPFRVVR